jgi:hypothetical protein
MTTVKIRWEVQELANVMTQFDTQRVWRSTVGSSGPWTEITGPGSRVALAAGVTSYLYDDMAGATTYYYAVSYYNSLTTEDSGLSDPITPGLAGYASLEDLRNEGLPTSVPDARAILGLARATAMIDQVTRQWFEPRTRAFKLDANPGRDLWFEVPVIAPTGIALFDETIDLADLVVYNRHLTQGLTAPDDRANPRIAWRQANYAGTELTRRISAYDDGSRRWYEDRQIVTVSGVFGYTDLGVGVPPGETVAGSQIPTTYGETPELIRYAALRLAMRFAYTIGSGLGTDLRNQARLMSETTRDQSYSLGGAGVGDNSYGITGDLEVDNILMGFMAPIGVGVV